MGEHGIGLVTNMCHVYTEKARTDFKIVKCLQTNA